MKTSVIELRDMLSVLTVDEVEKRLNDVAGVASATVNYAAKNATVRYDETLLDVADIKVLVHQHGQASKGSAPSGGDSENDPHTDHTGLQHPTDEPVKTPAPDVAAASGHDAGEPKVQAIPPPVPENQDSPQVTGKPLTPDTPSAAEPRKISPRRNQPLQHPKRPHSIHTKAKRQQISLQHRKALQLPNRRKISRSRNQQRKCLPHPHPQRCPNRRNHLPPTNIKVT